MKPKIVIGKASTMWPVLYKTSLIYKTQDQSYIRHKLHSIELRNCQMVEWIVWALTGTVLRLIRICPALRAPPDIFEFFKLLLQ